MLIYGSTSSLQATNIGSEHFEYENGHLIRDDESDTTTQSIIYDRWQDETISNNAASLQHDPTTGLTTTASATGSSTDHLTSHIIVNLTNIHTASLTNPGSDSTSGTSITTGTKQSNHNASSTIHQTGTLPTGESIDLNNIVILAAAVQTSFTSTGNLAADGTITSTDSSITTINIPTIYAAQFGTVRTTAAETGVVTTNAQCAVMDSRGTATNTQTITTVITPDGTSQSSKAESTSSATTIAFLLDTITSQVDAVGKPVGVVVKTHDQILKIQTNNNGVRQESVGKFTSTAATTPAAAAPPLNPVAPEPQKLLKTDPEDDLTLAEKQAIWDAQKQINQLMMTIRYLEKYLLEPGNSKDAKRIIQRTISKLRSELQDAIVSVNHTIPTGNIANGSDPVANLSLLAKLNIAIWKAIDSGQLSEDVVSKLKELAKPENLRMAVAFIAAYAAAHASPMAPGLAILDAYFLGSSATEVGGVLWQLYLDLDSATTEQELNAAAASLSKVLAGPIADGLLKALMVGAGKGAGKVAGEFNKRYQFQLPNGIKNGSRLNSGPPVPKIVRRKPHEKLSSIQKGKVEQHHSDPKFMGGDPKQPTTSIPIDTHRGAGESLHNDLNDFLRGKTDAVGNHMRPQRGNSGARIRRNFTRQELLKAMTEFYKKYGNKYVDAAVDFFK